MSEEAPLLLLAATSIITLPVYTAALPISLKMLVMTVCVLLEPLDSTAMKVCAICVAIIDYFMMCVTHLSCRLWMSWKPRRWCGGME